MVNIRKAEISDAKRLSLIAEETFRATFGSANSVEDMERHCKSSYSEAIQADEISSSDMVTFLSEDNGRLIGFAQLRWANTPGCVTANSPGELQRLYVVADWHGKGVAQELMNACVEEMKQHGTDAIWLGVWEHNPRAIAFYKKLGFVEVGEHIFPLGGDAQRDIVMVRPIASDESSCQTAAADAVSRAAELRTLQ